MGNTVQRSTIESSECIRAATPPPLDGPLVTEALTAVRYPHKQLPVARSHMGPLVFYPSSFLSFWLTVSLFCFFVVTCASIIFLADVLFPTRRHQPVFAPSAQTQVRTKEKTFTIFKVSPSPPFSLAYRRG